MDRFIKTELIDGKPKVTFSEDATYFECMTLSLAQYHTVIEAMAQNTINKIKAEHPELSDEEINKNVRAHIYDKSVLMFSDVMNGFFPEAEELDKRTPEELLEQLDAKVKELSELNKQNVVPE